jgi:hypothetical protein
MPGQGGLGLTDFQSQAKLFKMRYITKILQGHSSEWVTMARQILTEAMKHGPLKQDTKQWSVPDFLLLHLEVKIPSRLVRTLVKSWAMARPNLELTRCSLSPTLSVLQLYMLILHDEKRPFVLQEFKDCRLYAESRGIYKLEDLADGDEWHQPAEFSARIRSSRLVGKAHFERLLKFISIFKRCEDAPLMSATGWKWNSNSVEFRGWNLKVSQWRAITQRPADRTTSDGDALGRPLSGKPFGKKCG